MVKKADLLGGTSSDTNDGKLHFDLSDKPVTAQRVMQHLLHSSPEKGHDDNEQFAISLKGKNISAVKLSPENVFGAAGKRISKDIFKAILKGGVETHGGTPDVADRIDDLRAIALAKDDGAALTSMPYVRPGYDTSDPILSESKIKNAVDELHNLVRNTPPEQQPTLVKRLKGMAGREGGIAQLLGELKLSQARLKHDAAKKRVFEAKLGVDAARSNYDRKKDNLDTYREIMAIDPAEQRVQKCHDTAFHKLVEDVRMGRVALPMIQTEGKGGEPLIPEHLWAALDHPFELFMVQHDWAGAFEKAKDFDGGEVHFPADYCAFEFMIGGRRVIAVVQAGDDAEVPVMVPFIFTKTGWWTMLMTYRLAHGAWTPEVPDVINQPPGYTAIVNVIFAQIRALLIALEAEVAETEIVRAPHKLNEARVKKGRLPIYDYHTVSLAHRVRYAPREPEPGEVSDEQRRRRLHFVRGHWRHYTNHKVFVKWHLRGDPDLGFIDKHYKL